MAFLLTVAAAGVPSGADVLDFESSGNGFEYSLNNTFPGQAVSIAASYYPGWSVYIDGKKDRIVQTEKNLMQIFLDSPGPHKVRFAYEPGGPIERLSMVISVIAWASAIYLLAGTEKRGVAFNQ